MSTHAGWAGRVVEEVEAGVRLADERVREGRFQRALAIIAAASAVPSGLEVSYEHYRGSYANRIMYTPVLLSALLAGACLVGAFSGRAAKTWMRWCGYLTAADCVIGFGFHVRGIQRKPGGWRLPIVNMVMGPPIFAPLLFGVSAYLAVIASYLRRDEQTQEWSLPRPARANSWLGVSHEKIGLRQDIREGMFQQHMAAATAAATFFSAFEAWYSHYKNHFSYRVQWSPLVVGAALCAVATASIFSTRAAHRWLPGVSALALANGAIGFGYHLRGVVRRPGGMKKPLYNVMYGPPIFAPLLFAACGMLGVLTSLLRREK